MKTPYEQPPFPSIKQLLDDFLTGAREGILHLKVCSDCATWDLPIHRVCQTCGGRDSTLRRASGLGTIWSFTIFNKLYMSEWAERMPYNVAIIELAEGPRIFSNIVGVPNSELAIGLDVEAFGGTAPNGDPLLQFRPIGRAAQQGETA